MGSVDRTQFLQMIESDLKWFLRPLGLCHYLKGAIIAGSVTGRYYFDEFLLAKLPKPFAITQRIRFELKPRGADLPPFPPPTETRTSRKIITPSDIEALADLHASMNDVVRAIESEESPLGDD